MTVKTYCKKFIILAFILLGNIFSYTFGFDWYHVNLETYGEKLLEYSEETINSKIDEGLDKLFDGNDIGNIYKKAYELVDDMEVSSSKKGAIEIKDYVNNKYSCDMEEEEIIEIIFPTSYELRYQACEKLIACYYPNSSSDSTEEYVIGANQYVNCVSEVQSIYSESKSRNEMYVELRNNNFGEDIYINGDIEDSSFDIMYDIEKIGDIMFAENDEVMKTPFYEIMPYISPEGGAGNMVFMEDNDISDYVDEVTETALSEIGGEGETIPFLGSTSGVGMGTVGGTESGDGTGGGIETDGEITGGTMVGGETTGGTETEIPLTQSQIQEIQNSVIVGNDCVDDFDYSSYQIYTEEISAGELTDPSGGETVYYPYGDGPVDDISDLSQYVSGVAPDQDDDAVLEELSGLPYDELIIRLGGGAEQFESGGGSSSSNCPMEYLGNDIIHVTFCMFFYETKGIVSSKTVTSLEEIVDEINNVEVQMKNSGALMNHMRGDEGISTSLKDIKFSNIFIFDFVLIKKPLFPADNRKAEEAKQEYRKEMFESNILGGSDSLEMEKERNKYLIMWDPGLAKSTGGYAYDLNQYNANIESYLSQKYEANLNNLGEIINNDKYVSQFDNYGLYVKRNIDFWNNVKETLEGMNTVAKALKNRIKN